MDIVVKNNIKTCFYFWKYVIISEMIKPHNLDVDRTEHKWVVQV